MAVRDDPMTRFHLATERDADGHWLWTAAVDPTGYGRFSVGGGMLYAHRWAYEAFVGPIPDRQQIDHLCRVRRCVNPLHLEAVTQRENLLRGRKANGPKTHCLRGHRFDEANTYRASDGRRSCRTCRREARRAWRAATRSADTSVAS